MTEWRRTLRSWPKETSRTADPESMPAPLREPVYLREARREEATSSLLAISLGSLLPMGLGFAGAAWLDSIGSESAAALTMLSGMALSVVGLFPAGKVAEEGRAKRRRRRTLDLLDSRGEATLGGEFVGVAFGDRLWHHPGLGHDADQGSLTLDFDGLRFVGRSTRFELPKSAILSTEIRCFGAAITGIKPRLYVTYAFDGRTPTFSIAAPYRRSARRRVQAIAGLRERLEMWRSERLPYIGGRSFLAPPSGDYVVAPPHRCRRIGLPAKVLAAVATAVLLIAIEALATLVAIRVSWHRTGTLLSCLIYTCYLPWFLISIEIESRLPERWHAHVPEAEMEAPSLGDARTREEPQSLSIGRKSRL